MVSELDRYVDSRRANGPGSGVHFVVMNGPTVDELIERWRVHRRFLFDFEEIDFQHRVAGQDPPREKVSRLVRFDEIVQDQPAFPDRRIFNGKLYLEEKSSWAFSFSFIVIAILADSSTYGWGQWAFATKSAG